MTERKIDIKKYKFTIEKQKNWGEKDLNTKVKDGIEGFTVTDLPFSSVLQVLWFIYIHFINLFFNFIPHLASPKLGEEQNNKTKFSLKNIYEKWQDSDGYIFYNAQKRNGKFLETIMKIFKNTTNHDNTFEVLKYGNNLITSVSCNIRSEKTILNKILKILEIAKEGGGEAAALNLQNNKILGVFIVSGGGIFQKIYKKYFVKYDFLKLFPNNSINTINKTRKLLLDKNFNLKIFAAINTNVGESLENVLAKNADEYITQPPFLYSKFLNFTKALQEDKRGEKVKMRVGIPLLLSPWSLRFWYILCDINWKKNKEAENFLREFEEKYHTDNTKEKKEFKKYSLNFSKNLIYKTIEDSKNVIGFHIMPIGVGLKVEDLLLEIGFLDKDYEALRNTKKYFKEFEIEKVRNRNEEKIYIEKSFKDQAESLVWDFNFSFWQNVEEYMKAMGKSYTDSIGGSADSNSKLAKYTAKTFLENYKKRIDLNINDDLYYIEIGAAGARWCKVFLSELIDLAKIENVKLENLKYVFLDYSDKVLESTKNEIGDEFIRDEFKIKIEYVLVKGKIVGGEFSAKFAKRILRFHANNVYDNFPTNRVAIRNNEVINIKNKLFLYKYLISDLSSKYNLEENFLLRCLEDLKEDEDVNNFLNKIKNKFEVNNDLKNFYNFWQDFWYALKFEQDMEGQLEKDISDKAIQNMLEIYDNLHENGNMEIVDLLMYEEKGYEKFNGLTKYDGSLASYLNRFEIEKSFRKFTQNIKYTNMKIFDGKIKQYLIEINRN